MNLSEEYKRRMKKLAGILKEGQYGFDDDFDEGPQPGDAEYHHSRNQGIPQGRGNFTDIDWQVFYETLIANKETLEQNAGLAGNGYMPSNKSDLTDSMDGMMSIEAYDHLEENGLINDEQGLPILGDAVQAQDWQSFKQLVLSIWDEPSERIDHSPSTLRYRDDGGTDGG